MNKQFYLFTFYLLSVIAGLANPSSKTIDKNSFFNEDFGSFSNQEADISISEQGGLFETLIYESPFQ